MIYLDHAATGGEKPAAVQNAVIAAMQTCANPGRSGHARSIAVGERVLACRKLLSDLFGGYGFERVVFTKNCTEALNIAILGTLQTGDHAIASCLEHNSVLRPLEYLRKTRGVQYDVVPLTEGRISPEAVAARVRPETRLCCITAASNVTGEAPDLGAIHACLPERVLLLTDGAQAAGHLALNMRRVGADFLTIAGHKGMFAIQGAGALLFSERACPQPVLFGGTGSESYSLDMPPFYPDLLESGTLSYPAVCSLFEGALLVKSNRAAYARRLAALTTEAIVRIDAAGGYSVLSAPNASGVVSFTHARLPSETVAALLSERFRIAVRGGLHCAPLAHKALGTFPDGAVRASFSPMQGMREVRALADALRAIDAM